MDHTTALADRITHAEDWLGRARQQIQDGHPERGALTLLLAEAELHRAREVGFAGTAGPCAGPRQESWRPLVAVVAAAVAALAVGFLVFSRPGVWAEAHGAVPPLLRLQDGAGEMLRAVTAPEPLVERTVVERTVIQRVPVYRPVSASLPTRAALPATEAVPAAPRMMPAAAPVHPPAAPAQPVPAQVQSLLSDADVIELVLAAERSLRRSANQ